MEWHTIPARYGLGQSTGWPPHTGPARYGLGQSTGWQTRPHPFGLLLVQRDQRSESDSQSPHEMLHSRTVQTVLIARCYPAYHLDYQGLLQTLVLVLMGCQPSSWCCATLPSARAPRVLLCVVFDAALSDACTICKQPLPQHRQAACQLKSQLQRHLCFRWNFQCHHRAVLWQKW